MSSDIERRIVEIEFQNRNFEKSIRQSQRSIDDLNESLKFEDADKSIEQVQKALDSMNLHSINEGVMKISEKFSEMGIVGLTVLNRITNAALSTGKTLVKSFTVDPIISGLQEYETQMNSVQTILANTKSKGTNLDQVNAALDELNRYADKTIYNFTEMTRNIGTFTAAGVDLKTSVGSIQGIANLAAVSGSNAQQASTAMYQLSQALAAGRVSLMDWNSVVNAGMGGEVFQQALQKTSKELGTGAEAAIKAKGSFRESLQTGWLTSEVLTETLKKFTTSGANEWVSEYTGLTKETITETLKAAEAQYGEAKAVEEASKQLAEKSGKNQQEIKDVLDMAKTAEDAATKVKTFSQLMDTLKEAVQSGWSETWRTVVGDFEEAKELFTGVKDALDPIISKSAELRNNMLKVWKSLGGRTKLLEGLANISRSILDIWNAVSQAFYDVFGIVGKELYDITKSFADFTKELVVNEKTIEDIKRVVRGLASILGIARQIVSAVAKAVFQTFIYLKPHISSLLHFFAILGDGITIIGHILKQTKIFDRLGMAVARTISLIAQIIQTMFKIIAAGGIIVFDFVSSIVKSILSLFSDTNAQFDGIEGSITNVSNAITKKFPALGKIFKTIGNNLKNFIESIKNVFGAGLKTSVDSTRNSFQGFGQIILTVFDTISRVVQPILNTFIDMIDKLFSIITDKSTITMVLVSLLVGSIIKLVRDLTGTFKGFTKSLTENITNVSDSISGYFDAMAKNEKTKAIKNLATSIALIAGSLILLTFVDQEKLKSSALILGAFAGGLILFSNAADMLNAWLIKKGKITETNLGKLAASILSVVLVINAVASIITVLTISAALLSSLNISGLIVAFSGIISVMGMMALVFLSVKDIKIKSIIALSAIVGPIAAIAGVVLILGKADISSSIGTIIGFSVLLASLALCMKILSKLNPTGILYGCLALLGIGAVLLVLFGLFGLVFEIMGDGSLLVNGAKTLGDCLGALIGGIAGGISEGSAAVLPNIATYLSQFMTNIQEFISDSKTLKDLDFGSLFALTGLIATLSVTAPLAMMIPLLSFALLSLGVGIRDFIDATANVDQSRLDAISQMFVGIGNLAIGMLGFSSQNLESFGEGLPTLAKNIVEFSNALLGGSLSVETAEQGAEIFAAFAKVAATVPRTGGLIGAVLGDVDLGGFVGAMGQAGPAIKTFHDSVLGLQYENVEQALKILEQTIRVASRVPNSGGFLGMVVGENNLDAFSAMMAQAGPNIKKFHDDVAGLEYATVKEALKILEQTITIASSVPNSGGFLGMIVGENDLDAFCAMMAQAGPNIKGFHDNVKGLSFKDVEQALLILDKTITIASDVPNSGGLLGAIVGENNLDAFCAMMAQAGPNLKTFIDSMSDGTSDSAVDIYDQASKAVTVLGQIVSIAAGIDTTSGWEDFWSGGSPLEVFGKNLAAFAPYFKDFWDQMSGVTLSGDEMVKKTEAMVSFLDHVVQFAGVGKVKLPDLSKKTGQDTVYSLAEGMATAAESDKTQNQIAKSVNTMIDCFNEAMSTDSAEWSAQSLIIAFSDGLYNEVHKNSSFYTTVGDDILSYIGLAFEGKPMDDLVKTLSDELVDGVKEYLGIHSPSTRFQEIGWYVVQGLSLGLQNGNSELKDATDNMAATVENQFRDDMGIHSPSSLFTQFGEYIVDGLKNGLSSSGSIQDILSGLLGDIDFGSMFGDYGNDMKNIFSGVFDNIDLSGFSLEGLDDGSFVDGLVSKIQDQVDGLGLTAEIEAVFDADAMHSQLSNLTGTISTTGTGSIASATMSSFANTKFVDDQNASESGGKNSFNFVQNNYSPTALDRIAIYRQTRNQFAAMKEVISRV